MFVPIDQTAPTVTIFVDQQPHTVPAAASVALAMIMLSDEPIGFSAQTRRPRAPYCLMGSCHECLLDIDGQSAMRGCMTQVREGMILKTGRANDGV